MFILFFFKFYTLSIFSIHLTVFLSRTCSKTWFKITRYDFQNNPSNFLHSPLFAPSSALYLQFNICNAMYVQFAVHHCTVLKQNGSTHITDYRANQVTSDAGVQSARPVNWLHNNSGTSLLRIRRCNTHGLGRKWTLKGTLHTHVRHTMFCEEFFLLPHGITEGVTHF